MKMKENERFSAILLVADTPLPAGFKGLRVTSTCHGSILLPVVYFKGNAHFYPLGKVHGLSANWSNDRELFPENTGLIIAYYDSERLLEALTEARSWPAEDKTDFSINPYLCSECWKDGLVNWGVPIKCNDYKKKIQEGCACYKCDHGHVWPRIIDDHRCLPCPDHTKK
jgi:hypothetical protein